MAQEAVAVEVVEKKKPELTLEHKAGILLRQRQILSLQVNGNRAKEQMKTVIEQIESQVQSAAKDLGAFMEHVAKEIDMDPSHMFDLDKLEIVDKPQVQEAPKV